MDNEEEENESETETDRDWKNEAEVYIKCLSFNTQAVPEVDSLGPSTWF